MALSKLLFAATALPSATATRLVVIDREREKETALIPSKNQNNYFLLEAAAWSCANLHRMSTLAERMPLTGDATSLAPATGRAPSLHVADIGLIIPTGTAISATCDATITDIRSSHGELFDLSSKSLEGLRQPSGAKYLPSLLLWDDKGQSMYDELVDTQYYYPYRVENELLELRGDEIARTVAASGTDMLIELGAGNMRKTALILTALDKQLEGPLVYYALDIDQKGLERSLASLKERTSFSRIQLRGLLGTYEDAARWLREPQASKQRKTLVWLGNSIANLMPNEASSTLASFTKGPGYSVQNIAGFVLAVDGCQDASLIEVAYQQPGGQSARWVKYALEAARDCLNCRGADELLDDSNWKFTGQWDPHRKRYESFLVATRPLEGAIRGERIRIQSGERVHVIGSGKWTRNDVSHMCSQQGLDLIGWWNSKELDYGIYWLEPSLKRNDCGLEKAEREVHRA